MSEPLRVSKRAEVRYAETDAMGIVHHANYLVWFELARTELCRCSGHHYADIERRGYRLTVTGSTVRYRRPARYGDTVSIDAWIERLGSRGIRFAYQVRCDALLLATGTTEHIWIDTGGRVCSLPAELRPGFERLAEGRQNEG